MNTSSASPAEAAGKPAPAPSRRMVDAPTRAFHWLFALSFVGAYLTAESEHWRLVHVTLGYTLAGLLAFRLLWGLFGPRHVRLSLWTARLRSAPALLQSLRAGRLNLAALLPLLNALAVLSLLALAALATASGYLLYDEAFSSGMLEDALEEVHEAVANGMLAIVLLHLALIAGVALRSGPRQIQAMVTGRIPGRGPDLARSNRPLLATLMLAAVLAFWAWQWQGATAPDRGESGAAGASQELRAAGPGKRRHHDDD